MFLRYTYVLHICLIPLGQLSYFTTSSSSSSSSGNSSTIQFNSIHIYLRANLTAQRPITKLARVRSKKQQQYIYK
jgi:hypothetical protein